MERGGVEVRVLLYTHGTRGDVQPFVALAVGLRDAGHDPVLAAPAAFGPLVEQHGVPFKAVDDGPNRLLDDPGDLESALGGSGGHSKWRQVAAMLRVVREAKPAMVRVLTDMASAADAGADLVAHQANSPAQHIAEWLGVPAVPVGLAPMWVPTRAFPNPMLPMRIPAMFNRVSHRLNVLALRSFAGAVDAWRRDTLGLSRRRHRHDPLRRTDGTPATMLQAFSRHVVPPPRDQPSWVRTTGFWFLDTAQQWTPPEELLEFLAAGEPPVFIGFGSMPNTDPAEVGRLIVDAVRRAGVRAVLASGGGGLRTEPARQTDDVLLVDQVPHDWLLPRTAAVMHAGGAGTTAAAAAAGRPQLIWPFHVEQRFWALRMQAMGLGLELVSSRDLHADTLGDAIRAAVDGTARVRRAEHVASQIRDERGVSEAIGLLESEASRM